MKFGVVLVFLEEAGVVQILNHAHLEQVAGQRKVGAAQFIGFGKYPQILVFGGDEVAVLSARFGVLFGFFQHGLQQYVA